MFYFCDFRVAVNECDIRNVLFAEKYCIYESILNSKERVEVKIASASTQY